MICEYTMKELVKDAKRADLKFVTADSPYCDYCARKLFHDPEFDHGECETCEGASNFLGIQCITWGGDEE